MSLNSLSTKLMQHYSVIMSTHPIKTMFAALNADLNHYTGAFIKVNGGNKSTKLVLSEFLQSESNLFKPLNPKINIPGSFILITQFI